MATPEALDLLNRGREKFNEWRNQNPDTHLDLANADLSGRDLSGYNLGAATDLNGANLTRATLKMTLAPGARLLEARLNDAIMDGCDFSNSVLEKANLSGARITKCAFSNARLREARFSGAQIDSSRFDSSTCSNCDFDRAALEACSFLNAELNGAVLSNARLLSVDFSRAKLRGANFSKANAGSSDCAPCSFVNADLHLGSLTYARLAAADFRGADLSRANMRHAVLDGADLSGAKLRSASLHEASVQGTKINRLAFDDVQTIPGHEPYCGLLPSEVRGMVLVDGYMALRRLYGGPWALIYVFTALAFFVPILYILLRGVVLGAVPLSLREHMIEVPLWDQIIGLAKSGRLAPRVHGGAWSYPFDLWATLRFVALLVCHLLRLGIVSYVKTREHGHMVSGLYPDISLSGWREVALNIVRGYFALCLAVALIHACMFLTNEVPATIALH